MSLLQFVFNMVVLGFIVSWFPEKTICDINVNVC
jgi:hypothetical protein